MEKHDRSGSATISPVDRESLQAWRFDRQGLAQPSPGRPANQVLERSGWERSVGGSNPYLALYARAEISREQAEKDAANLNIHELPSARGCTYVIPQSDFALALRLAQGDSEPQDVKTAKKFLGLTDKELDKLMAAVLEALKKGPMDPKDLKDALGDAVRNLGPEGKKRGMTTTLPMALGKLQTAGQIRRVPVNGRLDQQRYSYALWDPSPLQSFNLTYEEVCVELARRYFRWIGPATLANFQWFSGLGVKATKEAVEPLGLIPAEAGSDLLIYPDELDSLLSFRRPSDPIYNLVSCIDGIFLLRREVADLLAEEDLGRVTYSGNSSKLLNSVLDLSNNAILDRGRLVGLWEYEPASSSLVWTSFVPHNAELKAAVAKTESFIRDQLGDARSFSLDSPESRAPQIAGLRAEAHAE